MQCSIFFSNLFLVEPSNIEVSEQAAEHYQMLPGGPHAPGRSEETHAGTHHPQQPGRQKALEVDDSGEGVASWPGAPRASRLREPPAGKRQQGALESPGILLRCKC